MDWVVKINYANGAGNGDVIWRLGRFGDFNFLSSDPFPWFSHQHDAEYDTPGDPTLLSLYDNANTRRTVIPNSNSRGQLIRLNEANRTATLVLNADLGHYAAAVGSAQRLANGNFHFHSGFINFSSAQAVEVLPNGVSNFRLSSNALSYRSFRMQDLYTPY
jgi:arylsulfate sulfotransferase